MLNDVPIEFCWNVDYTSLIGKDARIFSVGDQVVVYFKNFDWKQPRVIGFAHDPKNCFVGSLIVVFDDVPAFSPYLNGYFNTYKDDGSVELFIDDGLPLMNSLELIDSEVDGIDYPCWGSGLVETQNTIAEGLKLGDVKIFVYVRQFLPFISGTANENTSNTLIIALDLGHRGWNAIRQQWQLAPIYLVYRQGWYWTDGEFTYYGTRQGGLAYVNEMGFPAGVSTYHYESDGHSYPSVINHANWDVWSPTIAFEIEFINGGWQITNIQGNDGIVSRQVPVEGIVSPWYRDFPPPMSKDTLITGIKLSAFNIDRMYSQSGNSEIRTFDKIRTFYAIFDKNKHYSDVFTNPPSDFQPIV